MIQPLQKFFRHLSGEKLGGRKTAFWAGIFRLVILMALVVGFTGGNQKLVTIHHDHHSDEKVMIVGHIDEMAHGEDHHDPSGDSDGPHHHHILSAPSNMVATDGAGSGVLFPISSRTPAMMSQLVSPDGPVFDIIKPPQV